ncbi:MAG: PD-(D/E)XK nuclease family protein [Thermoleophilaceae bacterium]|nr:PD-(D/E)XK nuclease family protein [Thermoleophilaceae bacterium]
MTSTKINFRQTTFGRPAFDQLATLIAAMQDGDALEPVTVVVSSHAHSASIRRELARIGENGIAAVELVTLPQLASRIAATHLARDGGHARRPASQAVATAYTRKLLAEAPGDFAPIAAHPATAEALARAQAELRDVDDAQLDALASANPRAAEVVRVHRATSELMQGDWYDAPGAVIAATEALAQGSQSTRPRNVIVFLPEPLRSQAAAMIQALAAGARVELIVAFSGDGYADNQLATSLESLCDRPQPEAAIQLPAETSIVTTSDADDEVRVAIRTVVDALRAGVPARRIAVIFSASDPYARLFAEHLRAAEIEFNGPSGRSVRELAAARFLLGFMRLDPDRLRRDEVFGLLSTASVHQAGGEFAPLRRWRHLARKIYLNGSAEQWVLRLSESAAEDRARADGASGADYLRDRAQLADSLAEFVGQLAGRLRALQAARSWRELVDGYLSVLYDYLRQTDMPQEDRAALAALREILAELRILDDLAVPASSQEMLELLDLVTERRQIRVGSAGTGVRLLDIRQAVGLDADVVVICGCVEGQLPRRPGVDPLLTAIDRELLHSVGAEIRIPRDSVPRQHRDLLAAVAAAGSKLLLTMPRGDLRRTSRHVPSRWLLDVAAQLQKVDSLQPKEFEALDGSEAIRHVQSFGSGLAALADPATRQEYRLRLAESVNPRDSDDAVLARNAALVAARRSRAFTRFEGNLTGVQLPDLAAEVLSATRLEDFVSCPHAFFMHQLLGLDPIEEEDDDEISALDRGSLVHEVFDRFFSERLGMDFGYEWTEADFARLIEIYNEECEGYERDGRTGHPLAWKAKRRELELQLVEFLAHDQQYRLANGLAPRQTELKFGIYGAVMDALKLALPNGREIQMRGAIDRVDLTKDGAISISDYKTGQQKYYKMITEEEPLGQNEKLQLPIYAFAALAAAEQGLIPGAAAGRAVKAGYWFFGKDAGARTDVALTKETNDRALAVIGEIIELMTSGVFPQRTPEVFQGGGSTCDFCAPHGRGVDEVAETWARIKSDPALAAYVELAGLGDQEEDQE